MAAIVFIHGAGDSSAVWERQTAAFSKQHQVLAIDLPGHGARLAEIGFDSHQQNAAEVCRLMDQHGMKKAVVAGHSMGGAVALTLALNHPDRVQGLVLVATGARMKMRPEFLEQARESAAKYGNTKPGATHVIPVEQMVHPSMPPAIVHWLEEKTGNASAQATYGDFQANNNFDVMSRLAEIKVPTLVVGGSDDRMAPQKFAEFLANAIQGARLEVLTPSGHYPQVEQEEAFNRCFEAFLAAAVPAGATV
ncbi:MAG: alpha/beta hydrolase [Acidobacteria bacterium]|nr:alpha/beta hydrolase [Acidobacteriota bacterium]